MPKRNKFLAGITLVELIVVVVVIAILALILYFKIVKYSKESKNSAIKGSLSALVVKGTEYFEQNGSYKGFCASMKGGGLAKTQIEAQGMQGVFACNCDTALCQGTPAKWCACSPEVEVAGIMPNTVFCVDSNGVKKETAGTTCQQECPKTKASCQ